MSSWSPCVAPGSKPVDLATVVFIMLGLPFALSLALQAPGQELISSTALHEDLAVMRNVLETLHPGLYRYQTQAQWKANVREFEQRFGKAQSLQEAFVNFSQFLNRIQCGHTFCSPYNMDDEVGKRLYGKKDSLPFQFRWIDGKMVVTRDMTASRALPPGTRIDAIDGNTTREIFRRLMTITRADGAGKEKRRTYLEVNGKDRYEAFDIYYPLMFKPTGAYRITGVSPSGQPIRTTVDPIFATERNTTTAPVAKNAPLWSTEEPWPGTAVLKMPTWAVYNSSWRWESWLNDQVDGWIDTKVRNLVVDLRGNEGGLDCGDPLLARLISSPLSASEGPRWVTYQTLPDALRRYLSTWDSSFAKWGAFAIPRQTPKWAGDDPRPFYRMTKYDDESGVRVIQPKGNRFTGRVFVLIDSVCSSATFQFAQVVKQNRIATLMGEPTGGNQRGINGGAFFFCTLPNTKLEFDVPLIARFPDDQRFRVPDSGIEPDVTIRTTARDTAEGRDPVMERIRVLCK